MHRLAGEAAAATVVVLLAVAIGLRWSSQGDPAESIGLTITSSAFHQLAADPFRWMASPLVWAEPSPGGPNPAGAAGSSGSEATDACLSDPARWDALQVREAHVGGGRAVLDEYVLRYNTPRAARLAIIDARTDLQACRLWAATGRALPSPAPLESLVWEPQPAEPGLVDELFGDTAAWYAGQPGQVAGGYRYRLARAGNVVALVGYAGLPVDEAPRMMAAVIHQAVQ